MKNMTNAYHKLRACGVWGAVLPNKGLGTEAPIRSNQGFHLYVLSGHCTIIATFSKTHLYCTYFRVINRPGAAGAVLQTALFLKMHLSFTCITAWEFGFGLVQPTQKRLNSAYL